jgi:hypothetical protein
LVAAEASDRVRLGTAGWPLLAEALIVALLAAFLYLGLDAELPIDDTVRFTPHIAAGVYEWDAAHLLMQPAVVLWHRYLGFGSTNEAALASQERYNAVCAALSLGILDLLLAALGVAAARRLGLVALAALSFNLLTLATSGHIKLGALPFLALSLHQAVLWERDGGGRRLAVAAVSLGIATAFLISSLLAAPFLGLAVLMVSFRDGWRAALGRAAGVGVLCGAVAFGILGAGYALTGPEPASLRGFLAFLFAKGAERPSFDGVAQSLLRAGFGVVQNFVYMGDFGAMLRSALGGGSASVARHLGTFVAEGVVFLAAAGLLAWVWLGALRRRRALVPWAFLLGTLAFAIPWNLNEADFYFPITFPTVVMLAAVPPSRLRRPLTVLLLVLVAGTTLLGAALPRKRYPLRRHEAELQRRLTRRDVAVHWIEWSGGPSLIFMKLPGVARTHLDRLYARSPDPRQVLPAAERIWDRHLAEGGRVYLFGILDDRDWNAPWPALRRKGVIREELERQLRERYSVVDLGEVAGILCWELRP